MRWVLLREYFADVCMAVACSIFYGMIILTGVKQIFGVEQRTVGIAFCFLFPVLLVVFYRGLTKGLRNAWNGIVVEEKPGKPRDEWFTYMLVGGTSTIILAPWLAENNSLNGVPYFVIASAVFIGAALMLAILRSWGRK